MSKLNKSSKSPKPPVSSASDLVAPKPPAKESQKLELVKLISPPVKPEPADKTTDKAEASTVTSKVEVPVESAVTTAEAIEQSPDTSSDMPPSVEHLERNLPIPPATEPMQYRAIGLIQGRYTPEADQFSKGNLVTPDGTEIDAVLLGKVISIVKKRLDLEKDYYWVVYPRTRDKTGDLHVQIAGVWAPLEMGKPDQPTEPNIDDGYFSVRGEVTAQSLEQNQVFIKVRRSDPQGSKQPAPQKSDQKKGAAKSTTKFKIALAGILPANAVGQFWDINAQRQGNVLNILDAKFIATIPSKGSRKPFRKQDNRSGSGFKPKPKKYGDREGSFSDGGSSKPIPRSSSERPSRPILKKNTPNP
ncbi:hypothetical protein [Pseudanabaena sp. PCC 6802]|uniref:hypothetical protein n=1 Tax=Pseudanabaena sp. PCC 6802 TaxID=118173 RepID=UPI0003460C45|nr:hypothetical protein [Pseudanabaena sp. PCC 6802]